MENAKYKIAIKALYPFLLFPVINDNGKWEILQWEVTAAALTLRGKINEKCLAFFIKDNAGLRRLSFLKKTRKRLFQ
ncbi:MAG: hypothetical protein ACK5LX_11670 [Oscillospiraceae bacterium]